MLMKVPCEINFYCLFAVNVGEDCPVFDGLYEFCQLSAGGSVAAAVKLNKQVRTVSFSHDITSKLFATAKCLCLGKVAQHCCCIHKLGNFLISMFVFPISVSEGSQNNMKSSFKYF